MSTKNSNLLKSIIFFILAAVLAGAKKGGMIPGNTPWFYVGLTLCILIGILYIKQVLRK